MKFKLIDIFIWIYNKLPLYCKIQTEVVSLSYRGKNRQGCFTSHYNSLHGRKGIIVKIFPKNKKESKRFWFDISSYEHTYSILFLNNLNLIEVIYKSLRWNIEIKKNEASSLNFSKNLSLVPTKDRFTIVFPVDKKYVIKEMKTEWDQLWYK